MSSECRDWLKTLWAASYKGVPFYFEEDREKGGRDNVKHVFPHRDAPFIEDMGEALRFYSGAAYVHGDNADQLAAALKAALASYGAGTLVVPYFGGVTVHCEEFERKTERDKLGYVAFDVKFVRAGSASAFVSLPLLQNVAFHNVDVVASALVSLFPQSLMLAQQPDYVVQAAGDVVMTFVAALDVVRTSRPVDPAASSVLRDRIAGAIAAVPDAISGAVAPYGYAPPASLSSNKPADLSSNNPPAVLAATVIGLTRDLMDALPPASAVAAAVELLIAFATPPAPAGRFMSPSAAVAAANAAAAYRLARLAALMAYADSVLRSTFVARPDGVTVRGEVAERFENELFATDGAADAALYVALSQLRDSVIEWIAKTIADLAPVIRVESARIRPALDLAWTLYADPARATELVARNGVRHPSFMPREIAALSR